MNCTELNNDIIRLRSMRDTLTRRIDEFNKTKHGKAEAKERREEIKKVEDEILETYLPYFRDKNPELCKRMELSKKIKGFKDRYGQEASVYEITQISNDTVLVGGSDEALYEYHKKDNGEWESGERLKWCKDFNIGGSLGPRFSQMSSDVVLIGDYMGLYEYHKTAGKKWEQGEIIKGVKSLKDHKILVEEITRISDRLALIRGSKSLYECHKIRGGKWKLGKRIKGFKDEDGEEDDINAVERISNNAALVGAGYGTIYMCYRDIDGKCRPRRIIKGLQNCKDKYGYRSDAKICAIAQVSDNEILAGGFGTVFECHKKIGTWELVREKEVFHDVISSITQVSDDMVLIGGRESGVYEYHKIKDGKQEQWILGKKIEGLNGVCATARISEDSVLIGGGWRFHSFYEYRRGLSSVDSLKQNLDEIIKKGVEQ